MQRRRIVLARTSNTTCVRQVGTTIDLEQTNRRSSQRLPRSANLPTLPSTNGAPERFVCDTSLRMSVSYSIFVQQRQIVPPRTSSGTPFVHGRLARRFTLRRPIAGLLSARLVLPTCRLCRAQMVLRNARVRHVYTNEHL